MKNKRDWKKFLWNRKQKEFFKIKDKRDWQNLLELEKNLSKLKKYYDYDDTEYKGIWIQIYLICHLMKIIISQ